MLVESVKTANLGEVTMQEEVVGTYTTDTEVGGMTGEAKTDTENLGWLSQMTEECSQSVEE